MSKFEVLENVHGHTQSNRGPVLGPPFGNQDGDVAVVEVQTRWVVAVIRDEN